MKESGGWIKDKVAPEKGALFNDLCLSLYLVTYSHIHHVHVRQEREGGSTFDEKHTFGKSI